MSTINHEIYDLLRTYQRELNQREPVERKGGTKEPSPSFGKVLEKVTGSQMTEDMTPVTAPKESANSNQEENRSGILKSLNYDPAGYLKANGKERQTIIDFFQ